MDDGSREEVRSRPADAAATYRIDWQTFHGDWPVWIVLALDFAFGLWAWRRLPARVPVHWDLHGQPNGWGAAWEDALLMPAIAIGAYLLIAFLPLIDPRRRNYVLFGSLLRVLRLSVPIFMTVVHASILLELLRALPKTFTGVSAIRFGLPLLFIVIGNSLPQARFNYFVGIRTPWTLDDEGVWNATHRMAGPLWVVCGLAMLLAAFLPAGVFVAVSIAMVAVMVLVPVVYSWRLSKRIAGS
jgi:uncharacterized membrane protein